MSKPSLLMLDEPSLGLAPVLVARIGKILGEIQKGLAVLLAEQNATWARSLADRGVILDLGRMRCRAMQPSFSTMTTCARPYLGV